jgi:hypothetical protein
MVLTCCPTWSSCASTWREGPHHKQRHRLDEDEATSHVIGSRYRADQWASCKATHNPTRLENANPSTNSKSPGLHHARGFGKSTLSVTCKSPLIAHCLRVEPRQETRTMQFFYAVL